MSKYLIRGAMTVGQQANWFSTKGFMPHGQCFLWEPNLLGLHVISDSVIVASYYMIPIAFFYYMRKKEDIQFPWMYYLFIAFFILCGSGHLLGIITLWKPEYWIEGFVKLGTAGTSVIAAVLIWKSTPKALALPSPGTLLNINRCLGDEIRQKEQAQKELQAHKNYLEKLVEKSTRELQKTVADLKESEARYEDLYDGAPDMFVSVDAGTKKIIQCNQTLADALGYNKEDIVGRAIFDLYHPDCVQAAQKAFRAFVATGEIRDAELQVRRKDGSKIDVALNVSAVCGEDGKVLYSRSSWRDITARKRAEEEVKSLSKFPEENPYPVLRIARDGEVLYGNAASQTLLQDWGCKVGQLAPELWRKWVDEAFSKKSVKTVEVPLKETVFSLTISPVAESGHANIYGKDITERQQMESELTKSREQIAHADKLTSLGKLVGSVAHEFNNPLYGLGNIIRQIDEEADLTEEQRELTKLGAKECGRMAGLILRLQDFYKPSVGVVSSLDVHEVIGEVVLLTNEAFKQKRIKLEKKYCNVLPKIEAVEDQLKQVFLNVIQNAQEAIQEGGGIISISTEVVNSNIRVKIQDTGEGMSREQIKTIFDPFYSTRGIKGTGLGLSVSYGIIKKHGGDIGVESTPGKGSIFTISLPIKKDSP